ncbi:metallophosphoesterase [Luminiphilus sp.]|nr:metallophosphoesterase [Luminiphilus sp.]MDB2557252.1 metallophosphoesterase [Luminiphilus sp.]
MTLVQVTDTQLTCDSDGTLLGMNTQRTARQVIDAALAGQQPDCVLVTGDIAAHGQDAAYEQLNGFFYDRVPTLWLPGNHDDVSAQQGAYREHLKRVCCVIHHVNTLKAGRRPWSRVSRE